MEKKTEQLIARMIRYEAGHPEWIHHFLKVHNYARTIGVLEGLDEETLYTLETAAVVHDIGIPYIDKKFGTHAGNLQEQYGPALAEAMLQDLGYDPKVIERVSYLVGHHHTYTNVEGIDYRILLEADFLVNSYEENCSETAIRAMQEKVFETATGIAFLKEMFALN